MLLRLQLIYVEQYKEMSRLYVKTVRIDMNTNLSYLSTLT